MPKARDYITDLAAKGVYHFTPADMCQALGISAQAAKLALLRLAKRGDVASPARGFYVIVPPEYRRLGCLPPEQFIPDLMQKLGCPYYAGLLSAAQFYGAAHHRPQEFQVLVAKNRRSLECGLVRVAFFARKKVEEIPVQNFNTPRGTIRVSSVEATTLDLVGYADRIGGLDQTATILSELAEQIDACKLVAVARLAPLSWAQRLGYIMEHVQAEKKTEPLRKYVKENAINNALLLPSAPPSLEVHNNWRLDVNTTIEAET